MHKKSKTESGRRHRFESQMRQVQKMEAIGALAGGIAHDFNNILAIIQLNAAMALDSQKTGESAEEELRQILEATARAKELTMKILMFSRKGERSDSVLCLQDVVNDAMKMIRAVVPTSIDIEMNIDQNCSPVRIDTMDINQVMLNLCVNASQAMEEKGGLTIGLAEVELTEDEIEEYRQRQPGFYVRLTVSDTGCGMDAETKESIFEPFFTTKPRGVGTGMGLSVVYGIVESCGGIIRVESEVGAGTTFTLFFPVSDLPDLEKSVVVEEELDGSGCERILFVDDEEELASLAKRVLEKRGYRVSFFSGSNEALMAFKAAPQDFDLVVTDHNMPELTGVELAREILNIRRELPIILSTGYTSKVSTRNFRDYGFCQLLVKPYNPMALVGAVRRALDTAFRSR
ncbi:MAG TPA: response regulator [candidate division Zixibacteria bacterium]|nr:response regulator [candidate division Zixibacteria bacterium]